jgi:intracellular multiplication protein IcmC
MFTYRLLFIIIGMLLWGEAVAGPAQDLVGMMQTIQKNLGALAQFAVAISYVSGLWFIADSIFKLKKYGQARTMMSTNTSLAKPLILMAIGAALFYFPTFATVSIQSLWAYGSSNSVLKYPAEPSFWDAFVHPLIDLVRLFGLIAVIRGLVLLTKLSHENPQPGSIGKGILHIIAGTLAINIVGTIDVIKATFGF